MPRTHAPHEAISPVHVLALVRGLVEEAAEPCGDRYRYFKSLLGTILHEAAAIRCGLAEHANGDLRVTPAGLDLYERHLRHLPAMAANYWHDQPHVPDAVKELRHIYDQAARAEARNNEVNTVLADAERTTGLNDAPNQAI